jgi:hypothetical protein
MTASDKLFTWLFQSQPDRILQLLPELAAAEAGGYRFVAPVFKALEHRPDGVFLAVDETSALPALALLLESEERLPATTAQIRARVVGTELEPQIADATAAILLARLTSRPIPEICAMAGITLEDFTQSVAYREIFGLGELDITLRLLRRRCGSLTPEQDAQIRALPRPRLEALAEALLDFQGSDDLNAWLAVG